MVAQKSYNRKYSCSCIASNGHPLTIWSTRPLKVTCNVCGTLFTERQKKTGEAIPIRQSYIEQPGDDMVAKTKGEKYQHFVQYRQRRTYRRAIAAVRRWMNQAGIAEDKRRDHYDYGTYQAHSRAFLESGYKYWVAYSLDGVDMPSEAEETSNACEEEAHQVDRERTYSADNPQDLIDLYHTDDGCSTRKLAKLLGISQPSIMRRIEKYKIDFTNRTYMIPEEKGAHNHADC